jgi:teichuronic acid biosynthesis protein TuaE
MNVNSITLQRLFFYLTIISVFTGNLFISIEVGPIHIFPFRIFMILMWFLFLTAIFVENMGRLSLSHIKVKLYLEFYAIWLSYAFLSIIWVEEPNDAIKQIIFLFTGISIVFFLVYYISDLRNLKFLYWLLILIFIALIPVGLWEIKTGEHLVMSTLLKEEKPWMKFFPTAVFTNQNDFAAYIALTLPMVLTWIRYYPNIYSRVIGIIVLITGVFLLVVTTSRSCYLAFFMGIAFWFTFLLNKRKKIKIVAIGAICCIIVFIFFSGKLQSTLTVVGTEINTLSTIGSQEDDSIDIRQNLIKNAIYFFTNSVGFGVGAGNAEYYMGRYAIYPIGTLVNVHNWWVEILLNYGVFIFAGYVILYMSLILNLWQAYRKLNNRTEKMICEALLVGLISFFMASISSSSIFAFSPQWIFFGFALAFLNYIRNTSITSSSEADNLKV